MSELVTIQSHEPMPLPSPRVAIDVRVATMDDLAFIDSLQKKTSKQVGFMPTKQLEGKIALGHVIVAEVGGKREDVKHDQDASSSCFTSSRSTSVGYLIGCDRYFKHDDVGIIYAINIVPDYRRSLVAASLLKAQFERSAYGCKLYCCWCAQDIDANRFWEAMGFVPLASRAGSERKARVHLFWQKRIRAGDTSTPWWFPSQTKGGSIREDRIVLPIPPGMHWSDAQPAMLPGDASPLLLAGQHAVAGQEEGDVPANRRIGAKRSGGRPQPNPLPGGAGAGRARPTIGAAKFQFAPAMPVPSTVEKPKRERKPKAKNDPRLVSAARELRDRWLEQVNAEPRAAVVGKYEVNRAIGERIIVEVASPKRLAA